MKNDRYLFAGCIAAIAATSFGFVSRAFMVVEWTTLFNLSQTQIGALQGAGLYPFAISIIGFSFAIDRIGYGRTLAFAWCGHVISAAMLITAHGYSQLYAGTLIFSLANGALESAVNPVVASLYSKSKTGHLNILHAGWPAGMVMGGLLTIAMGHLDWRWRVGLFLIPTALYGAMLRGRKFPSQERVSAGVSYRQMLQEFGWAGCLIVSFFIALAVDESLHVCGLSLSAAGIAALTLVPALIFGSIVRRPGRPLFIFLLAMMILLATTELGVDSWVTALMTPVLSEFGDHAGDWILIYTASLMAIMRVSAGFIVHRISPLALLSAGSLLAAAGLLGMSYAGSAGLLILAAATVYGVGKSFFWPTTLGVVSEQFPRGGALTLNAMGGMGMIAVGVLGNPLLGVLQDVYLDRALQQNNAALYAKVTGESETHFGFTFRPIDEQKALHLNPSQSASLRETFRESSYATLQRVSALPILMFCGYLALIFYFRGRGGYRPVDINDRSCCAMTDGKT